MLAGCVKDRPFPGLFGAFYEIDRPTKNSLESTWIAEARAKAGASSDVEILQKTFDRLK
jgi:2-oxoglutarate/2-oxoacid ferredoxin oxidoreductase subunit beta